MFTIRDLVGGLPTQEKGTMPPTLAERHDVNLVTLALDRIIHLRERAAHEVLVLRPHWHEDLRHNANY